MHSGPAGANGEGRSHEEAEMGKAKRGSATKKIRDLKVKNVRGGTASKVKGGALKAGYNITNFN